MVAHTHTLFKLPTLVIFPLCLLATLASASVIPVKQHLKTRAQWNPSPTVGGSPDEGWKWMPDVQDAVKYPDWVVDTDSGATMPLYQTWEQDNNAIKRAVIVISGKGRDCWSYWNTVNNALYNAASQDPSVLRSEVSIMAPCFWTQQDRNSGAAKDNSLLWGSTTWISGKYNVGPDWVSKYSSFDVLDALVAHYMDRSIYPNLETVVLAGHSAGGQMTQRYAVLRSTTDNDDRLHFWVGNPGSFLWLTSDRPIPNDGCDGVDVFKYGLQSGFPGYATGDVKTLGRDGIVSRYRGRNVHYAQGLNDHGPGDTRCQAFTQGNTHLERGSNFVRMLEGMEGGFPSNQTVDWIEGVSHDNEGMINSAAGLDKIFRFGRNCSQKKKRVAMHSRSPPRA